MRDIVTGRQLAHWKSAQGRLQFKADAVALTCMALLKLSAVPF
jgi:hypothetical protein